jgi:outer membrane lipoprotein SlyB
MQSKMSWPGFLAAMTLAAFCGLASAQSSVSYGRITAVQPVTTASTGAQRTGALVGGTIGLASGSGQSGSNRALRAVGGGFAGQQVGRLASSQQSFEYTVLLGGTSTITIVTDQSGMRVGDCVSVERGSFNNLRLVADAKCARPAAPAPKPAPTPAPTAAPAPEDQQAANACLQAKEALFEATTEDAFNLAERRVRLLCH